MSSRFVTAGGAEVESPVENDDWARARKQVEERKKPQTDSVGTQEGGKSLYEHLQAQKAAKQDAFEEASRLRNQFRPLDDSEVDFLESIQRNERAEAADLRKATAEQLDVFRLEQAAMERMSKEGSADQTEKIENAVDAWTTSKKRRRPHSDETTDMSKVKKVLTTSDKEASRFNREEEKVEPPQKAASLVGVKSSAHQPESITASTKTSAISAKSGSTLVAYDSGSDSDS